MKMLIPILLAFTLCHSPGYSAKPSEAPAIKSVTLLDKDGNPLSISDGGWVRLQAESVIEATYEGAATHVDFYTVPTGSEVQLEQRLIGSVDTPEGDTSARLVWNVPDSFMGYIWVLVYNGDVARSSEWDYFIKAIYE